MITFSVAVTHDGAGASGNALMSESVTLPDDASPQLVHAEASRLFRDARTSIETHVLQHRWNRARR